jgi:predicted nucleic acid-binding protein
VHGKIRLLAPEQLIHKVGNSIWENRALTAEDAAKVVEDLMDLQIELICISPKLAVSAMKMAREFRITFYDVAYIALADHYGASLISTDAKIRAKVSKNIVRLEDPQRPFRQRAHRSDSLGKAHALRHFLPGKFFYISMWARSCIHSCYIVQHINYVARGRQ